MASAALLTPLRSTANSSPPNRAGCQGYARCAQHVGEGDKHTVTGLMSECVVDLLEALAVPRACSTQRRISVAYRSASRTATAKPRSTGGLADRDRPLALFPGGYERALARQTISGTGW
jgi:hypothetical protein